MVNLINKWKLGNEKVDPNTDHFEKEKQSKILREDNIAPEEVVEIIKDYCMDKITYVRLKDSANRKEVKNKLDEIKEIFFDTSNGMEWKKINVEAIEKLREELKIEGMEKFNQWMQKENNYLLLGKKIISLTEQNEILLEYMILQKD